MELVTLLGVFLGLFAVFGGALIEGLHLSSILQGTAALIVFGGTIAATMVSFPQQELKKAISMVRGIFRKVDTDPRMTIDEIVAVANVARKEGLLGIEPIRASLKNELFKKSLKFIIDGFEPSTVKEIMNSEIEREYEEEEAAGKVWESAGGYAPTIGIIGAVMGLIHVLSNLKDPNADLGSGIAVAFVATIYGVASANLILIPFGTKIKRKALMKAQAKEIVVLGISGIQEGANPMFLKERLSIYLEETAKSQTHTMVRS